MPGTVRASITVSSVPALLPCFVWWKNRAFLLELSRIHVFTVCRSIRAAFDQINLLSTALIDLSVIFLIQIYGAENVGVRYSNNCYGCCLRTCRRHRHIHYVSLEADNDPIISECCSQASFSMMLLTAQQYFDNLSNPSESSFYSGTVDFLASAKDAVRVDLLALSHYHQQFCPGL